MIVGCFAYYGLNKYRNFIVDGGAPIVTKNIYDVVSSLLERHGCDNAGVFLVYTDGKMEAITYNGSEVEIVTCPESDAEFFSIIDAEFRLCCYGLLLEQTSGEWTIVEEVKDGE